MASEEPRQRFTAEYHPSEPEQPPPGEPGSRLLRRSKTDEVIAGVAGGLGRYLGIDPVLIRIAFIALAFVTFGTAILFYIIAWIVIPEEREGENVGEPVARSNIEPQLLFGGALILLGLFFLLRMFIPWFDGRVVAALVLIALGLAVLLRGSMR